MKKLPKKTPKGENFSYLKSTLFTLHSIFNIQYSFLFRHHRGRPRLKPWFPFYFQRLKKFLGKLIPKKSRLKLAIILVFFILFTNSIVIFRLASQLPSPTQLTPTSSPLTTQILDRNGKLLYQIYNGRNRTLVKIDDLPPYVKQATVAIEDKHFFIHPGVDFLGISRAVKLNLDSRGESLQGGSTITQQLIKNTLLTPEQTWNRKIKEAILAFWTEIVYSKKDILQMYLNESPYGGPAWGVQAAAEMYFGKQAKNLTLAESAYLAGLPASPTEYSPYGTHPQKGKERQKEVLRRMVEDRYISQEQSDEAYREKLALKPPVSGIEAPHFVMYVKSLLVDKYGERTVSQGGLKVITTLDLDLQQMAERVVADQIEELSPLKVGNGGAMITNSATGEILAMVGSKNYFDQNDGNFNIALALRQPGSSIKPVTYAAAFKAGLNPRTIVLDTPITFLNPWGQAYTPVNYDGKFRGPVTVRLALGSSLNIPAVRVLNQIGIPNMLSTAKDLGITTLNNPNLYGLSLTLGAGEVKMIDMMNVYGTLASGGIRHDPFPILSITDPYGTILENHSNDSGTRVLSEEISYMLTNILSDPKARAPAFGEHSLLEIPGFTVAVKTGTTDNKKDNWAFGFTARYTVGVWVGNNDNTPMDPTLTSGITGATPIWHNIMAKLLEGQPDIGFKKPKGEKQSAQNEAIPFQTTQ